MRRQNNDIPHLARQTEQADGYYGNDASMDMVEASGLRQKPKAVAAIYRLREFVLSKSRGGRDLIGLFYGYNRHVRDLFIHYPKLLVKSGVFIAAALPVIEALNDGEGDKVIITEKVLAPSLEFFNALAAADEASGSTGLASEIRAKLQQLSPETLNGVTAAAALARLDFSWGPPTR